MKTPEQLATEIDDLINTIWRSLDDPETLSKTLEQLAVKYRGIGNYLHEAYNEQIDAKRRHDHYVETQKLHYVGQGDSATVAESKAKIDSHDQKEKLDEANKRLTWLKLAREDIELNLDVGRSRLSLIKGDIRQS